MRMPESTQVLMQGLSGRVLPAVERTEMERGVPKQSRTNSQSMCELKVTLYFPTVAAADEFEDWYFDTLGETGWFNFDHPLNGRELRVRFKAGEIGELTLIDESGFDTQRTVTLEYLR